MKQTNTTRLKKVLHQRLFHNEAVLCKGDSSTPGKEAALTVD